MCRIYVLYTCVIVMSRVLRANFGLGSVNTVVEAGFCIYKHSIRG